MANDYPPFPSGSNIPPVPEDAIAREPGRLPHVPARGDASSPHTTTSPTPKPGFWGSWFKSAPPPEQPTTDGFREIIETVVFVIVLVLLLKSFVAEAFVIPTGSMAETLYGNQKIVTCPACGIIFPVNCSREVEALDGGRKEITGGCFCPNCRKRIDLPKTYALVLNRAGMEEKVEIGTTVPCTSGDRVLVAKFLYDLLGRDPDRLDVVVFKYPGDSSGSGPAFPDSGPFRNHTPMNYIKRLIGEPGEVIAIHCGKVYVLPREKAPQYDDVQKLPPEQRAEGLLNLWQRRFMHEDGAEEQRLFRNGQFNIMRKGPDHLLSMMRLVYNNDHPPTDVEAEGKIPPRWSAERSDSWKADANHGFSAASSDDKEHWLRYQNNVRDSREQMGYRRQLISDFMGYNSNFEVGPGIPIPEHDSINGNGNNWVGDLILETEVTVNQAQGELVFELSKADDRFQARLNLADGLCQMVRLTERGDDPTVTTHELDKQKTSVRKGNYHIRFANVDNRLLLWIDGKLIFPDGVSYEAPLTPIATKKNDLDRPASIAVKGADVQVRHLKLFRDTYYTPNKAGGNYSLGNPDTWKNMVDMPVLTLYVQPDHFLCLGDNSPASSDSRTWGLVPRRLMLGRALAVYYPFYFPFWPLSSQVNRVGLIH